MEITKIFKINNQKKQFNHFQKWMKTENYKWMGGDKYINIDFNTLYLFIYDNNNITYSRFKLGKKGNIINWNTYYRKIKINKLKRRC
jgi:hypothetical protein